MRDNFCPLCGKTCLMQPIAERMDDTLVKCDDCGSFKINKSIFEAYNSKTDLVKSKTDNVWVVKSEIINKRCNQIFDFLLRKPFYHKNGYNYYFRFFYDESTIGQTPSDPLSINIAEHIQNYLKI